MSLNAKEEILAAARKAAQARGYGGLNFRDLAKDVGIKHASIYYHFPTKADLGAAVARRYWEDTARLLEEMSANDSDPIQGLRRYPEIFRKALETGNRMCLCSFMAAEYDDLPEPVKAAPLALLVGELLGNCVRHAFPGDRGGVITVTLAREGDQLRIEIADDGVGVATTGTSPGAGQTIVKRLCDQLRADCQVSDARPGVRTVLRLPLSAC